MPQSAEKILDHAPLFREPEYQELFKRKQAMPSSALLQAATSKRNANMRRAGSTGKRTWRARRWL